MKIAFFCKSNTFPNPLFHGANIFLEGMSGHLRVTASLTRNTQYCSGVCRPPYLIRFLLTSPSVHGGSLQFGTGDLTSYDGVGFFLFNLSVK